MFGFLNIYKPEGITSFDVIAKLRKILNIKQIGHAGTLDPQAVGVLPIAIGKATRLLEFLPDDKAYIAEIQLGYTSTTYDKEGEITKTLSEKLINEKEFTDILNNFKGEIEQTPPMFSAVHYNGKRLYELARDGKQIDDIPKRKINISKLELLNFDFDKQKATILVHCSKGTYIRSLVFDIGYALTCGAYMTELERIKSGAFLKENSIKLEDITTKEIAEKHLINPIDVLSCESKVLTEPEKQKVLNGNAINDNQTNENENILLVYEKKLIAIGIKNNNLIKIKKVFV